MRQAHAQIAHIVGSAGSLEHLDDAERPLGIVHTLVNQRELVKVEAISLLSEE